MKNIHLYFLLLCLLSPFVSPAQEKIRYKDPGEPIEARVEDLLSRMTLDEKLAQLQISFDTAYIGTKGIGKFGFMSNNLSARKAAEQYNLIQRYTMTKSRLGIPGIKSGEGLFTYMGYGAVCFPQPLALAASWDPEIMNQVALTLNKEIKSRGIFWVYSPVVNIARDSRWGRTSETYGEDPLLSSQMGVAYVKTMEDKNMLTCPKHFVANMGLEGRFGAPVHFSERLLREIYFPAYKACFQEGGAKSVMMAYNTLDGIPCTAHKWLMTDILRNEWGFDGIIMSDGDGMRIAHHSFGVGASEKEFAALAMNAGCDVSLSFQDRFYRDPLRQAIEDGLVPITRIDDAVRAMLRQKFRLELFDNPYVDPDEAERLEDCPEHRLIALNVAEKTAVLLKNDNNTLPFDKNVKTVAVLGPLADWMLINHYGGFGSKRVSVLEGIRNQLPGARVLCEKGAELSLFSLPAIPAKCFPGGLKGEYFDNPNLEGNPKMTRTDKNIDFEWGYGGPEGLPTDNFSVRWTGKLKAPASGTYRIGPTYDDGVRLRIDGQLITDNWHWGAKRLKDTTFTFEKGRTYRLEMEYYDGSANATAHLGWNVDMLAGIPPALEAAKQADAIVIVCGMWEDENGDRADLDLEEPQETLIKEVAKLNKPFVVVLQSGGVITMHDWVDEAPAILQTWYPGEEGGNAIARILFGDVNPGGKLPITIPQVTGQVPMNYNHLPYKPKTEHLVYGDRPEFPFGHGLSYTTFEYSNPRLSARTIKTNESLSISADITNTGNRSGDEVVQLYVHDLAGSVARRVKELKAFERITLEAGQTKTVHFKLFPDDFSMYDAQLKWILEPGEFDIMIGSSSEDIRISERITVE